MNNATFNLLASYDNPHHLWHMAVEDMGKRILAGDTVVVISRESSIQRMVEAMQLPVNPDVANTGRLMHIVHADGAIGLLRHVEQPPEGKKLHVLFDEFVKLDRGFLAGANKFHTPDAGVLIATSNNVRRRVFAERDLNEVFDIAHSVTVVARMV